MARGEAEGDINPAQCWRPAGGAAHRLSERRVRCSLKAAMKAILVMLWRSEKQDASSLTDHAGPLVSFLRA
jgi:hypothetical protein